MYEVLIAHLRECAKLDASNNTYTEAADAIEELKAAVEGYEANTNMVFDRSGNNTVIKFEPKWIPVTERLPKENGNYLVAINCPRGKWVEICASDGREWVSIDEYAEYATKWVTHWMPLPEPPKEE